MPTREHFEQCRAIVSELYENTPEEDCILTSGERWVYGCNEAGERGFYLRTFSHPLENVTIMPLKLAARMHEFTGGSVSSVKLYLGQLLRTINNSIELTK
jgi:hypothetical protein